MATVMATVMETVVDQSWRERDVFITIVRKMSFMAHGVEIIIIGL